MNAITNLPVGSRVERIGRHTLIHADCRDWVRGLTADAIVTDPPYGLGEKWNGGKRKWPLAADGRVREWDATTAEGVVDLVALAPKAIIWGGQNYPLPPSRAWLVWDKILRKFSSGHCELAWTNLDQPIRAFNYSHGELANEGKVHPTQKPVPLMEWCLSQLPEPARIILDPFMGSGSTGVACERSGRDFIGIEIDPDYFAAACRRVDEATRQADLFISGPPETAGSTEGLL